MKLLITNFSPFPYYLVPLRPKYSPQRPILKHPQPPLLLQYQRPSFTPIFNALQIENTRSYRSARIHHLVFRVTTTYIRKCFPHKEIKLYMLRYSLFPGVTFRVSVVTDDSVQTFGPTFNCQVITINAGRVTSQKSEYLI
jgi:hypothetical protein